MSDNVSLRRKAGKVIFKKKEVVEEYDSKEFLDQFNNLNQQHDQLLNQINQLKDNLARAHDHMKELIDRRLLMKREEEWAVNTQKSVFLSVYDDIKSSVADKVREDYRYDKGMKEEGNRIQMFHMYRELLARDTRMRDNVSKSIISEMLFGPDAVLGLEEDNPFSASEADE